MDWACKEFKDLSDVPRSEEEYVRAEVVVAPGPSLPPGTHYLPFLLTIPPGLPSSFEAQHGSVRYLLLLLHHLHFLLLLLQVLPESHHSEGLEVGL